MELLRFTTTGSVDDGKSTLIGRLLYDSKAIFDDQIENLKENSRQRGEENINLALLTDGLRIRERTRNYNRCCLQILCNSKKKIYHCRYSRPYTIHTKYGNRSIYS